MAKPTVKFEGPTAAASRRPTAGIFPAGCKPINLHFEEYAQGRPYVINWDRSLLRRDPHFHDFHEIAIITRGVGHHLTEYGSWPVRAGDVLTIGCKHIHCYDDVHDLEMVNVLFEREPEIFADDDIRELDGFQALFGAPDVHPRAGLERHFRLSSKEFDQVLRIVAAMEQELSAPQPGAVYLARAHFMVLIGTLSRLYSIQPRSNTSAVLRLAKAINYIEANFRDDLHLTDIARAAGMSGRQLQRLFKLGTGDTPLAYLHNMRLMRAAEALRDTEKRVTEVAFASGFNDSNYFSRQFQKFFGVSPRQYRHNAGLQV